MEVAGSVISRTDQNQRRQAFSHSKGGRIHNFNTARADERDLTQAAIEAPIDRDMRLIFSTRRSKYPRQDCFGYGGLIVAPAQKLRFRELIWRMADDLVEARDGHEFTPPIEPGYAADDAFPATTRTTREKRMIAVFMQRWQKRIRAVNERLGSFAGGVFWCEAGMGKQPTVFTMSQLEPVAWRTG